MLVNKSNKQQQKKIKKENKKTILDFTFYVVLLNNKFSIRRNNKRQRGKYNKGVKNLVFGIICIIQTKLTTVYIIFLG